MATLAAFIETRNLCREYIGYTEPLSFEEWVKRPTDQKAAILFVQFFEQITLAWDKANAFDFIDGEEGVSVVFQYLQKQVEQVQYFRKDDLTKKATAEFRRKNPDGYILKVRRIIEEDPKKFSPGYIYRVAYNCMYCICHDLKSVQDRWNFETSAIAVYDDEEVNLFDTVADRSGSAEQVAESLTFETEFWRVIENTGLSAEKAMRYLLSQDAADLAKRSKRDANYEADPLSDIELTKEALDNVLAELRDRFLSLPASSFCGQYLTQLQAVC